MNDDAPKLPSRTARAALIGGLIALFLLVAAPAGYRLGLWDYPFAIKKLTVLATLIGLVALIPGMIGLWATRSSGSRQGRRRAVVGLLLALSVVGVNLSAFAKVKSVPFIHDITTDTDWPPGFVTLAEVRDQEGLNGSDYAGAEVAELQKKGYPDLSSVDIDQPPGVVFAAAVSVINDYGWDIAAMDQLDGRIEATATTLLYGFKDDIVLRLTPTGSGTRIDMRSASRVGQSDLGANADRIRCFMSSLKERLGT